MGYGWLHLGSGHRSVAYARSSVLARIYGSIRVYSVGSSACDRERCRSCIRSQRSVAGSTHRHTRRSVSSGCFTAGLGLYRRNGLLVLTTHATRRSQDTAQDSRRSLGNKRLLGLLDRGKEECHNRHNLRRGLSLGNLGGTSGKQQRSDQPKNRIPIHDVRRHHVLDGEAFLLGFRHLFLPMKMD